MNNRANRANNLYTYKEVLYQAELTWAHSNDQAEEDRQAAVAKAAAIAKRTAFLTAAAAIPLFPEIYAGWLVDYLKTGGTVYSTHKKFPRVNPWASPSYEEDAIWMLTDPQAKASEVPVSDYNAQLKIYVGYGQDRFRNQFAMMTNAEATAEVAAKRGRRNRPAVPETPAMPGTKAAQVFGQTAVFMASTMTTNASGEEQFTAAYTNRSGAACLYRDIDEMVRNLTATDRVLQHRLDEIDVYGSTRAIGQ